MKPRPLTRSELSAAIVIIEEAVNALHEPLQGIAAKDLSDELIALADRLRQAGDFQARP